MLKKCFLSIATLCFCAFRVHALPPEEKCIFFAVAGSNTTLDYSSEGIFRDYNFTSDNGYPIISHEELLLFSKDVVQALDKFKATRQRMSDYEVDLAEAFSPEE